MQQKIVLDFIWKQKPAPYQEEQEFYSILNDEEISDKQYRMLVKYGNFKMKNMGDYHNLYLQSDILLLGDVFENFRNTCMRYYKLDPCHYSTSPGLSWLKMTESISDIDMYQFVEKGLRGGTSYIAHRHGKAKNPYMKDYNHEEENK